MKIDVSTRSAEETRILGAMVGERLAPGGVIALEGDLGSGKTAFVQGLARGLEVPDSYYITSPTYTLINEYPGRIHLYHVDLYRLDEPGAIEDIGLFDIMCGKGVTAIEWAEKVHQDLPSDHLSFRIEIVGKGMRFFSITAYGRQMKNLVGELNILLKEQLWA